LTHQLHCSANANVQYWWLCYIGYCLAMILSKISIGVFLLRVAVQKIHRWIIYAAMAVTGFTGAVFFFVTVFQCTPISFFCKLCKKRASEKCANHAVTSREQAPARLLRTHRCHHRPYFPVQRLCDNFRLHFRYIAHLFDMEFEYARQDEDDVDSCLGHGVHVSIVQPTQLPAKMLTTVV
jgi:hypothetical protein